MVRSEDQEADQGGCQADHRGGVGPGLQPLVGEEDREHGGQNELKPPGVETRQIAQDGPCRGPAHPVGLVEEGDEEHEPAPVDPGRFLVGGDQGEGLVTHAEDQVGLLPAGSPEPRQHGQSVEEMAGVDHQGQGQGTQGVEGGEQEIHGHEFHGACEYQGAHGQGIDDGEPLAGHQEPIGDAKEEEAGQDGQGHGEGRLEGLACHRTRLGMIHRLRLLSCPGPPGRPYRCSGAGAGSDMRSMVVRGGVLPGKVSEM